MELFIWFKDQKLYRLSAPRSLTQDDLEAALASHAYRPGDDLEMRGDESSGVSFTTSTHAASFG